MKNNLQVLYYVIWSLVLVVIDLFLFLHLLLVVIRNESFWFPYVLITLYFITNSSIPLLWSIKKPTRPLFQNLKALSEFLFKSSRCLFYGKGNGWFEFVMFDSFEMFAQFFRWSLLFISDGNNIQVPSIFCGSVTATFILIDLCSPGLRVILQANIIYKHYFVSVLVFWYFSQKKW